MGDKSCPTEYKGGLKNLECHLTLNGWGGGGGREHKILYRALWWGSDELYRDVTKIYGHARQQIMTVDGIVIGQRVDVTRDSVRLDLFHKFHFTINVT